MAATTTTTRPKLPQLKTPMTASFPSTFPSELSALSARTPLSAFPDYIKAEVDIKTPITPPTAYTDFLKSMASPVVADKPKSGSSSPTSTPLSATSSASSTTAADDSSSSCPCTCDSHNPPASATAAPSPFVYPTSAKSASSRMRLQIPPSPAFSLKDTESPRSANPLSATSSMVRSPFSARSPYDWDVAAKSRWCDAKSPMTARGGIRHVREIVTRTVTYTPRMSAAPKGKRRKVE